MSPCHDCAAGAPCADAAHDAIRYILRRRREDPDLGYYIGHSTESLRRLCVAWAAVTGQDLDVVERWALEDAQPSYRRREPEVIVLRRRRDEAAS